jgi:hypothetical protein
MAALPGIPLSLASIFFGWRAKWRQLKAEKTQHSLEKKRKSKKRHKDRWYLLIEGLTWISLGAVSIFVAMFRWGSVPRGYSDYGMEPFAKFLEYVVISVPVGVLILAGAVGLIVGAVRVLVALTILFTMTSRVHTAGECLGTSTDASRTSVHTSIEGNNSVVPFEI